MVQVTPGGNWPATPWKNALTAAGTPVPIVEK
jgi:hypothetical protein